MTPQEIQSLIGSLATIGAAIASGQAAPEAATYALSAIIRETPYLFAIGAIVLSGGKPTEEQLKDAHAEAVALGDPASIPPAK